MSFFIRSKENFDKCIHDRKVACFGYGNIYKRFLSEYPEYKSKIDVIIDNDLEKSELKNVYGPNKINDIKNDHIILITSVHSLEIRKQLDELQVPEEIIFWFPFEDNYEALTIDEKLEKRMYAPSRHMVEAYTKILDWNESKAKNLLEKITKIKEAGRIIIPYCTILVTGTCTLNCRDCNNLIPYLTNNFCSSYINVRKYIDILMDSVEQCVVINFTGGEPFTNSELHKMINYASSIDKISAVEIITNGTIMPSEELCHELANEKVIVKISNYKGHTKTSKLTSIFDLYNIRYVVNDELVWMKSGNIERRNKEKTRLHSEYMQCWAGMFCKTIQSGKLYHCARAAFLDLLDVGLNDEDSLSIGSKKFANELKRFYIKPFADACDFCDHHNIAGGKIPAAIQVSKK